MSAAPAMLALSVALSLALAPARGAPATPAAGSVDPRVSRSRGVEGGVVVLWPRVIPSSAAPALRPQAAALQRRLREMVGRTLPGRRIEARPEPERVCPQGGCLGLRVGVLLIHRSGGCAVVAAVGPPGRSMTRLIPWAGELRLKAYQIPFRAPPESYVIVDDHVPCGELLQALDARAPDVERALRQLGRAPSTDVVRPLSPPRR